jgi:hypothetical protein
VSDGGPTKHLGAVLDELVDTLVELKQGRRAALDPSLQTAIDALAGDLREWAPRVADAITAAGDSPLAVATSVAGHHPLLALPGGSGIRDLAALLANHLGALSDHVARHARALPAEDPAVEMLSLMNAGLVKHEVTLRDLAG